MKTPNWIPASALTEPGYYWRKYDATDPDPYVIRISVCSRGFRVWEHGESDGDPLSMYMELWHFQPVAPFIP